METRLFHEFLVLTKLLNFSRAAEQLGMTQPVLTRHIKYLEEQFGAQLLDRNTHKVELTMAGRLLAEEAAKIISQYEASFSVVQAALGKGKQKLAIAFLGEATRGFLLSFLTEFRRGHAAIAVECSDTEIDTIPAALAKRTTDLAFSIRPNRQGDDGLQRIALFNDPLCAAVNRNHPLAERDSISIREIGNWSLIGVNRRDFPLAGACNSHFVERYGVEFKPVIECPNLQTCCFNLELHDNMVVMLPKHRRDLLGPNSVMLDIEEKDCQYIVELVWDPQNRNPSISTFVDDLRAYADTRGWGEGMLL